MSLDDLVAQRYFSRFRHGRVRMDIFVSDDRERSVSSLGAEFEATQLAAEARALGAEMYQHASRISLEAVDAVAAVLFAFEHGSGGRLPAEVAGEYARQMMADAALRHRLPEGKHVRRVPS